MLFHYRSPNITAHRTGHGSAIRTPLSACSTGHGSSGSRLCDVTQDGVGLTPEPVISSTTVGTGPRAGPAAADFVGLHTKWRAASQNSTSHRQTLWKSTQPFLSPQEHSSLTYLTLKLGARSGSFYSNWGADPTPNRAMTATEQRVPNIQCRLWSPQHKSHPLSRG